MRQQPTANPIAISLSVSMKVNLGNYESADAFLSLSNIPTGATEAEIVEALETGQLAWGILKGKALEKARDLKATARASA